MAVRSTQKIWDGNLMNDFVESRTITKEQLRSLVPKAEGPLDAWASLRNHWPEYLMEAGEIALYMFLICAFATLLLHPASPLRQVIHSGLFRRVLMGFLVGSAVIAIIMTPWGKQSGGHFNPAITLTFYRLRKLAGRVLLCCRAIRRRRWRCRRRGLCTSRCAQKPFCALRGYSTWHIWQRRCIHWRSDYFFRPDDWHPVCL